MTTAATQIITVLDTSTTALAKEPILFVISTPTESYIVRDISTIMKPTQISVWLNTYLKYTIMF